MANLLQVSSAYGRAMESVNRTTMSTVLYPVLKAMRDARELDDAQCDAAIASCAEGYPFPTNLDTDPPSGGLAPESQQQLMRRAIREGWSADAFEIAVRRQHDNRQSDEAAKA